MARVLLVEDNLPSIELMQYVLRAFGHEVEVAPSSEAGLASALAGGYDIVVTDILMPGIDGYQFLRRFRRERPNATTKIVAVTALAMVGDKEKILGAGFDAYIPKPIDPERFAPDIEALLV